MAWTTLAPAKINLDLRMLGVRADGYHLLRTVLQSIALADRLTLHSRPGPFAIACETPGVPNDSRNLAWKGAAAMAEALGVPLDGWELRLEKGVPAESGLGGGSADAVAAARLVAAAAGVPIEPARLADVVRPLGADVAFFAWGGAMLGEGIGDQLSRLPDEREASVVLVRPPFGVSTRDAYRWFDETQRAATHADGEGRGPRADGRLAGAWTGLGNDLEGPVAARHPEIRAIVERLGAAGATHAAMSGSGSACFGLFGSAPPVSLESGWPAGTQVWQTRLLSSSAYAAATAVHAVAE